MPIKPLKPCARVGCGRLTRDRHCAGHAVEQQQYDRQLKQQHDSQRGSAHERGYDSRWQKFRAGYLRSHPLCVHCQADGRVTMATEIHHVTELARGGGKYDHDNLQALCKRCHSRHTAATRSARG